MKNNILFLTLILLMGCNSNSNQKQSEATEKEKVPNDQFTTKPTSKNEADIFEGMYSYMADANMFVSCDQKWKIPVEMKGEYLNLERQYLRTVDGGTKVYVKLKGSIKKIPAMEGDKKIDALFLEEILELTKDKKCP